MLMICGNISPFVIWVAHSSGNAKSIQTLNSLENHVILMFYCLYFHSDWSLQQI